MFAEQSHMTLFAQTKGYRPLPCNQFLIIIMMIILVVIIKNGVSARLVGSSESNWLCDFL